MRRAMALMAVLLSLPVLSVAAEFDWMVREFARESGVQPLHIPFFGLARFLVAVAHPAGARDLRLAVFEHPNMMFHDFSRVADSTAGGDWKKIVQVRSKQGESTNIYVQPDGKLLRLLIATFDHEDAVLVQVKIRPEELIRFVDQQRRNHHA